MTTVKATTVAAVLSIISTYMLIMCSIITAIKMVGAKSGLHS